MTEEEQLKALSGQVDDILFDFVEKNDITFLELCALVLARLSHVSRMIDEHEKFATLLRIAEHTVRTVEIEKYDTPQDDSTIDPSTNIHLH